MNPLHVKRPLKPAVIRLDLCSSNNMLEIVEEAVAEIEHFSQMFFFLHFALRTEKCNLAVNFYSHRPKNPRAALNVTIYCIQDYSINALTASENCEYLGIYSITDMNIFQFLNRCVT